jgi:hypothetical protein
MDTKLHAVCFVFIFKWQEGEYLLIGKATDSLNVELPAITTIACQTFN